MWGGKAREGKGNGATMRLYLSRRSCFFPGLSVRCSWSPIHTAVVVLKKTLHLAAAHSRQLNLFRGVKPLIFIRDAYLGGVSVSVRGSHVSIEGGDLTSLFVVGSWWDRSVVDSTGCRTLLLMVMRDCKSMCETTIISKVSAGGSNRRSCHGQALVAADLVEERVWRW